jgi:hypothetical protein
MSAQTAAAPITASTVDPVGRGSYRVGGLSALLLGLAYIITIVLYARVGAPPSSADGGVWLRYLAGKTTGWWAILGLSVFTDLLYAPVALSLYLALKGVNRSAMLVATAFMGLFVALDLAVTWANYAVLISLSGSYAAATSDTQRASDVAAANYPAAILSSRLETVYAIGILSFAILVIGFVMLRSIFGKLTAYVAVLTGIAGIASLAGFSVAVILNAVLAIIWLLLAGFRLVRLSLQWH